MVCSSVFPDTPTTMKSAGPGQRIHHQLESRRTNDNDFARTNEAASFILIGELRWNDELAVCSNSHTDDIVVPS